MINIAGLIVFPMFLLFLRMGGALMVFPGFSDISIPVRVRLLTAVMISLALFPLLQPQLPPLPDKASTMLMYMGVELFIGVAMAMAARFMMAALNTAGELIGFTSGLHAASLFDPQSGSTTVAPALFLSVTVITLIFITNLHHLMIQGVVDSYRVFPPGHMPPLEDTAYAMTKVLSQMFAIGTKIAAPVVVTGFLLYVAFGIFSRLVPQLQVFFVALPITIIAGLFVLWAALAGMILLFMDELRENLVLFTQGV